MSENFRTSTIPYTLIVGKTAKTPLFIEAHKDRLDLHRNCPWVQLSNVALTQNPSETLTFDVYFTKSDQCDKNDKCLYNVSVFFTFQNNLHEFNQNYVYEVFCEQSQSEMEPADRLFTFFAKRTSNRYNAKKNNYLKPKFLENERLCFYIRRHNLELYNRKLVKCINYKWLYQEIPANVKLCVDGETILVHKFLLTHKSEVFKAMFTNEMTETETSIVRIEDFSVDVIKEMVNFMYTGQASNIKEMRYQLYKAAHKYQLHDLCFCCIEYIVFNVNFDNIVETLELACLYDMKELENSALNFMKNHPKEMSKAPSYQNYMCRTMNVDNAVDRLLFARLCKIEKVSEKAFDFIGQNFCEMKNNCKFNELFQSDPLLMKEIVHYYCDKYAGKILI